MVFSSDFYRNVYTADPNRLYLAAMGGLILGLATSLYYVFFGGIFGVSGMCQTILRGNLNATVSARHKIVIILGMVLSASLIFYHSQKSPLNFSPFEHSVTDPRVSLILAGLLVGLGTQLGNGCTSGHGLCGMARLSVRSITAVMVFLMTAIATATFELKSSIPRVHQLDSISLPANMPSEYFIVAIGVTFFLVLITGQRSFMSYVKIVLLFGIGGVFGFGLMVAGMTQRSNIFGFLELNSHWNPALFVVLMSGVAVNLVVFTIMRKLVKEPLLQKQLSDPHGHPDLKLLLGATLFGLGWGLGGLCPGPFLLQLSLPNLTLPVFWGIPFMVGIKIGHIFEGQPKVKVA